MGNAVRVCQNIVCGNTEDLLLTQDQGRVFADHFIQDHRCGLTLEVFVGRQISGQLGFTGRQGVIQNGAVLGNVVLVVLVVRKTLSRRCGNVDDVNIVLLLYRSLADGFNIGGYRCISQECKAHGNSYFAGS